MSAAGRALGGAQILYIKYLRELILGSVSLLQAFREVSNAKFFMHSTHFSAAELAGTRKDLWPPAEWGPTRGPASLP